MSVPTPHPPGSGDLRKLAHFVAVAEELHFTRAAERLHMAQQALSSSVRRLERDLGVQLLVRSTRRVELTPAGRALLEDAPAVLAAFDAAWRRAQQAGQAVATTPIRVGRTPALAGDEVVALLEPLRAAAPDIAVHVTQRWPAELPGLLRGGELDLAFSRATDPSADLVVRPLHGHGQRLAAALHPDDPDADAASLPLAALHDRRLVVWGRPERSGYTRFLVDLCVAAGFTPELRVTTTQGAPPLVAVERVGEFAFVTDPPGPRRGVTVVALEPPSEAPVRLLHVEAPSAEVARIADLVVAGSGA